MVSMNEILSVINEWHKIEDGRQTITGDIDDCAKVLLAKRLELMFASPGENMPIARLDIPKHRRGRPPKRLG